MSQQGDYRQDVQALRGVAVLLVVVFHAMPAALPGGYVGVDVFFVISGYLITGLLMRELEATGRVDFGAFYARRIRRLLPAAALVIAATTLVALSRSPPNPAEVAAAAFAAAGYVSNLWFALLAVDYLQEDLHRNVLLHTWSLGVEEQFYLLWPALIIASTLLLRGRHKRQAVATMVAAVSALSFGLCLWLTESMPSWAFFGLPARAWELGVGAAAALLEPRLGVLTAPARRAFAFAGLLCIAVAGLAFSSQTRFPGHAALLPVFGAFLVIVAGAAGPQRQPFGPLRLPGLQRLGDLSYSWYLWHWPVLIFMGDALPQANRHVVALAGVSASLMLAAATYAALENPVRRSALLLRAGPSRTYGAALLLTIGTVGVVAASFLVAQRGEASHDRKSIEAAARDRPRLYDDRCFAAATDIEPPDCVYGAGDGKQTVVLVGDSHAAQWFPAVEELAKATGLRLFVYVKAACPLARVEPFDPKLNRPYVECSQWREKAFERIARLRPALVIGASDSFYEPFVRRDRDGLQRWQDGLVESLDRLGAAAGHVVLIRDTPRPGFNVPGCLARAQSRGGTAQPCPYFLFEAVLPAAFEIEQAAVQRRPNTTLLDMNDTICTTVVCPVQKDGVILFHDSQHLSATFVRSLAALFWQRLPEPVRADLAR